MPYLGYKHSRETREKMIQNHRGMSGRKHSEETLEKMREAHKGRKVSEQALVLAHEAVRGKKPWNWKEDRALLKDDSKERGGQLHREWSRQVKDRDGWKCKISNKDCKGWLEAHHILGWTKYPELRYEVNNGITLCHFHHPRKRKDEMRLSPYFQNLVAKSAII